MKKIILCFIIAILCFGFFGCSKTTTDENLWENALYTEDVELGEGENTVFVEVVAQDKTVTFTVHSDKTMLGDALSLHNLIDGEKGAYGLYVKKVNGIVADYDVNRTYWSFLKNGESMMCGVDMAEFKDGDHYEFVYTK